MNGLHSVIGGAAVDATRQLGRFGRLAGLVVERLLMSDVVAASKFGTDSPVDDPAREERLLEQVRRQADAAGTDPETAEAFFRDQITASKVVQNGLFARWAAHPEEVPRTRPDLCQIRERLDQLTADLLRELGTIGQLPGASSGCTERLALAGRSGTGRLDALHRRALRTATRSVCDAGEPARRR